MKSEIVDETLIVHGDPILSSIPPVWGISTEMTSNTTQIVFLHWEPASASTDACYCETLLGKVSRLRRFTSCHRFVPFWLHPVAGKSEQEAKPETLWILAETKDAAPHRYVLIVPVLSAVTRHALRGSEAGLVLTSETGNPGVPCEASDAICIAIGDDPYGLVKSAAQAVLDHQNRLGLRGRLRRDKPTPDFIEGLGWCTWDAFYKKVSPAGVLSGLKTFSEGGVNPSFVILDDGWQSIRRSVSGEEYLHALGANERFEHDLSPLIHEAKTGFGVRHFLVWHAILGYWGGLDPVSLSAYEPRLVPRLFGPGILEQDATWNTGPWGAQIGVPEVTRFAAFYDDYHRLLKEQGVDGVKVDAQAFLEAVAWPGEGRVSMTASVRQALESSVKRHFHNRLINCMGATNECASLSEESVLLRTSDDFFPERPESHGKHLYTNAQASLWLGEFMLPDWDMFQSGHESGGYHAAARAISGGPVYVSDRVGEHDFEILRKLTLSDGTVLRSSSPALPSPDCLFSDPTKEQILLKVFNKNGGCGVLGVFNARLNQVDELLSSVSISVSDVPSLAESSYMVWTHLNDKLKHLTSTADSLDVSLTAEGWELATFAPIEFGFAAFGLSNKFNSSCAIVSKKWDASEHGRKCHLSLRDGGSFLAWSHASPVDVLWNDERVPYEYNWGTGRLSAELKSGAAGWLCIQW